MNAIELLRQDHERLRKLFREYGEAGDRLRERRDVAEQVLMEIVGHSTIEDETFYPAARAAGGAPAEQVERDQREHEEIDRLVAELKGLSPADERFQDRFQALIGAVEYHIAAEEGELLPAAARARRPAGRARPANGGAQEGDRAPAPARPAHAHGVARMRPLTVKTKAITVRGRHAWPACRRRRLRRAPAPAAPPPAPARGSGSRSPAR